MQYLKLKKCPFLGYIDDKERPQRELPTDYITDPFKYLPPKITLSSVEHELANRYVKGDMSGGYVASQIARFRRGPTAEQHHQRRKEFAYLRKDVEQSGLILPSSYIELVQSDEYVARLRHNNIWLQLPDQVEAFPSAPEYKLFLIFAEAQGCGYWHLLLSPDGSHVVTFSEHHFGLNYMDKYEPDPTSFQVFQCADNFEAWLVNFFTECIECDHHYELTLKDPWYIEL